jgi:membrane-associated phospholipid phosphatase
MIGFDHRLERWVVGHRVSWLNGVFEELSRIGSYGLVWLAIAIVLALVWQRPSIFVRVLIADALAELLSGILRAAIPRARPHNHPLVALPHTHSFPSGHSATSFACATVLAGAAPRLRVPLYLLAAAIAYSRVYNGVHWPLDVLAGAALGVGIGFWVRALRLPAGSLRRSRPGRRAG